MWEQEKAKTQNDLSVARAELSRLREEVRKANERRVVDSTGPVSHHTEGTWSQAKVLLIISVFMSVRTFVVDTNK